MKNKHKFLSLILFVDRKINILKGMRATDYVQICVSYPQSGAHTIQDFIFYFLRLQIPISF